MNAAVNLIERALRSTAHVRATIPESHPSCRLLGNERMGSATIVDAAGLVLTVNYIVVGAERVTVTLRDERSYVAEVLRQDFDSGLALLRIAEQNLPAVPVRHTTDLAPGEEVFIVASIGDGGARVSSGAVSYIGPFDANWEYVLERAIMTTAMNPGLGGGPLLDTLGRLVGTVSLNLNEIGRFSLAIPADYYLDGRAAFLAGRHPTRRRAWLGVFCYAVQDHVVIAGVLPGGPGEQAGLKVGDVILAVDEQAVGDRRSLYRLLWAHGSGDHVALKIFRGREQHTISVTAGDVEEFFA
ncbi:MAG TPA: S1C family serine protease [Candidatus Binatus sp.]|nr:S1C family serine protease [Candidatus Binatus sp.]